MLYNEKTWPNPRGTYIGYIFDQFMDMKPDSDGLTELTSRLKERGFRMTPQRLSVIRVLTQSTRHPTVDDVYNEVRADFPMTSLATIYKTVALLKEIGALTELTISGDRNRYDGSLQAPHAHLICTKCNRIQDVESIDLGQILLEQDKLSGFEQVTPRLDFFGVCPDCQ
jgi:Fur family peroxide stress response transcriptional regulator